MPNDALHLRVVYVAGDEHEVALGSFLRRDLMYFRHEGTSRIEHTTALFGNFVIDCPADSVRADNDCLVGFELADVLDNAGSLGFHIVHDVLIVDNGSESSDPSILFELVVDHFNGSVHSEAESGGLGNSYFTHYKSLSQFISSSAGASPSTSFFISAI